MPIVSFKILNTFYICIIVFHLVMEKNVRAWSSVSEVLLEVNDLYIDPVDK